MKQAGSLLRSSLVVSAITLGGSVVSFANQLVLAHLFGAGSEMDVYLVALSLPAIVSGLVVGAMGYQLVPALQHSRTQQGSEQSLLRALEVGVGGSTLLLAAVCAWKSQVLVRLLNPGLSAGQLELASGLAAIGWCALPLATLGAIYAATLHIRSSFFVAAMLGPFPAVGTMVLCLLAHSRLGIASIAWGQLLGYLVAVVGCRAALGSGAARPADWRGVRDLLGRLPLGVAALLLFTIYPFSDAFWGVRAGPSAVSYLGYAQRILVGFSGLAVVGATTVLFPRLAKYAAEGDHQSLHRSLISSLRMMLAVMGPAAAVFAVLSAPAIRLLFARGAFTGEDTERLARLLSVMLAGMVAMSLMGLAFKALFALRKTRAAAALSIVGAVSYFALSSIGAGMGRVEGIGAAYSITWWITLIGACVILGINIRQLAPYVLGIATLSVTCAGAALAGKAVGDFYGAAQPAGQVVGLMGGCTCALAVYGFAVLVWPGVPELRAIAQRRNRQRQPGI
jgi:putative peptidoglycan lipid II flippase